MKASAARRVASVLVALLLAASCSSNNSNSTNSSSAAAPRGTSSSSSSAASTGTIAPTTSAAPGGPVHLALRPVVHGLASPVGMAVRHGDPALYVAEQYTGRVVAIVNGRIRSTPLLDLHGDVSKGNEQGLLDLAFSPDGTKVYIDYTDSHGDTNVDEYRVRSDGTVDPNSRRRVLFERQPFPNHNGGEVLFGRDGMLYIGLGDGGSEGDPQHNGQNRDTLLGKILRIDPNASGSHAYTVPADNPFVGVANTKPEIWMWGLRNPWRFSFDSVTGAMWIGDVGQDRFEEIDVAPKGSKGLNFEWSRREGFAAYNGGTRPPGGVDPVYAISHADGSCAVVGGYVYRGHDIPGLSGKYLFTDDCKGDLMMLTPNGTHATARATNLGLHTDQPTSFGEDQSGELYVLSRSGTLYKIVPA